MPVVFLRVECQHPFEYLQREVLSSSRDNTAQWLQRKDLLELGTHSCSVPYCCTTSWRSKVSLGLSFHIDKVEITVSTLGVALKIYWIMHQSAHRKSA